MPTDFALLLTPASNLVYGQHATRLSIAELQVLNATVLGSRLSAIRETTIGGVPYLAFAADGLDENDLGAVAYLSGAFALFQQDDRALLPLELPAPGRFPSDLLTIQKYPGKTNPSFTRLLMNVTLFSGDFAGEMRTRPMSILDPLCGRGTTLNQALMYGYNAAGIEIDGKDFDAYQRFLVQWLKDHRIKHHVRQETLRGPAKTSSRRLDVVLGVSKEAYKDGSVLNLDVVNADTSDASQHFKAGRFDAIVSDFPYGVLHGSRSDGASLSRRPLDLCAQALPGWIKLLRPGGTVGFSWNTHVAGREKFRRAVGDCGLQLLDGGAYGDFRHDVDSSITRDIVIARKPS